jgi:hypothetical protein
MEEAKKALKKQKNNKFPVIDTIPSEFIKPG